MKIKQHSHSWKTGDWPKIDYKNITRRDDDFLGNYCYSTVNSYEITLSSTFSQIAFFESSTNTPSMAWSSMDIPVDGEYCIGLHTKSTWYTYTSAFSEVEIRVNNLTTIEIIWYSKSIIYSSYAYLSNYVGISWISLKKNDIIEVRYKEDWTTIKVNANLSVVRVW